MTRSIELNNITKVEGHAKLYLKIGAGDRIERCDLESIEGSRYFEGMLLGRKFHEAPEISSRICGICSCAHVMAAIEAMEKALGPGDERLTITPQTAALRELFTMGERIRSHITHIYFLSLPDYFGVESGLELAKSNREDVLRALRLMKLGNDMIEAFAGRDLHPVSATVGGFLHLPERGEIETLLERLKGALPDAIDTVNLLSKLDYPEERGLEDALMGERSYLSLVKEGAYPTMEGELWCVTSGGHVERYREEEFFDFITEYHEESSTANFVVKEGKSYMVGALARLNNNSEHLHLMAKKALSSSPLKLPSMNPYHIPLGQAIEVLHFIEDAIDILSRIEIKEEIPAKPAYIAPRAGRGIGVIEVPRGILVHDYEIDEEGKIIKADIVTPTAQNLRHMEERIRELIPTLLHLDDDALILEVEKLIRSFDPCFSCSTHFLDVTIEGRDGKGSS